MFGSVNVWLPLLVLDHDTALDARFVHRFFNLYYRAALVAAARAAAGFAGRFLRFYIKNAQFGKFFAGVAQLGVGGGVERLQHDWCCRVC